MRGTMGKGCQPNVRTWEKGVSISLTRPTNLTVPRELCICNCERYMSGSMIEVTYGKGSDTRLLMDILKTLIKCENTKIISDVKKFIYDKVKKNYYQYNLIYSFLVTSINSNNLLEI